MQETIKVGLVGYGMSAKVFHAPFLKILPQYEVVSVLERHKEDSKQLFPKVQLVRSLEELLQTNIDLVVITTPNETHYPYTVQCLQAGKHVVIEKPFTITSIEARELAALAKKAGRVLSVYQNRRYVSDYLTIKNILQKNLLGKVHEFEAHYDRYRAEAKHNAWREVAKPGSGILYDLGAHIIDQSFCLFGLPAAITADIRMQRPHARVDDYFDLRLDYGFLKVILRAGMLVREPGPRYMIHGTKGSFIKYGEDTQEAKLKAGELPVSSDWGSEPEEMYGLLHTEIDGKIIKERVPSFKGNYGAYYEDLYATIVNNAPLKVTPEQGYNTIRLIELAFESAAKKCTVECTDLMDVQYE